MVLEELYINLMHLLKYENWKDKLNMLEIFFMKTILL